MSRFEDPDLRLTAQEAYLAKFQAQYSEEYLNSNDNNAMYPSSFYSRPWPTEDSNSIPTTQHHQELQRETLTTLGTTLVDWNDDNDSQLRSNYYIQDINLDSCEELAPDSEMNHSQFSHKVDNLFNPFRSRRQRSITSSTANSISGLSNSSKYGRFLNFFSKNKHHQEPVDVTPTEHEIHLPNATVIGSKSISNHMNTQNSTKKINLRNLIFPNIQKIDTVSTPSLEQQLRMRSGRLKKKFSKEQDPKQETAPHPAISQLPLTRRHKPSRAQRREGFDYKREIILRWLNAVEPIDPSKEMQPISPRYVQPTAPLSIPVVSSKTEPAQLSVQQTAVPFTPAVVKQPQISTLRTPRKELRHIPKSVHTHQYSVEQEKFQDRGSDEPAQTPATSIDDGLSSVLSSSPHLSLDEGMLFDESLVIPLPPDTLPVRSRLY